MSKMSKAIAVLGVVAGLGVAALPLSTYADSEIPENAYVQSATANVKVEVGGAISIATSIDDADFDATTKTVDLGELMPGGATVDSATPTLKVRVSSNGKDAKYSLYMNAVNGDTNMVGTKTGSLIPTANSVAAGTSSWAYKMDSATDWSDVSWNAIPADAKKIVSTDTLTSTADQIDHTFKFGAAVSTTQLPDVYVGKVVFTAALEG